MTDSDQIRVIRLEAGKMCEQAIAEKTTRIWWVIGTIFALVVTVTSAAISFAIADHGIIQANSVMIRATDKRLDDRISAVNDRLLQIDQRTIRIEDKLDLAADRGRGK